MLSIKKANGTSREYKVTNVKIGITKNGSDYTLFRIKDSTQSNGQWQSQDYLVFVFKKLDLEDNDKIEIKQINSIEIKTQEYNGNQQTKATLFCDVEIIEDSNNENNKKPVNNNINNDDYKF